MPSSQLHVMVLTLAAIVVFGSGFLLRRLGKPYRSALLNLHKLVDLAAVVVIGLMVCQADRAGPLSARGWLIIGLLGALFVALFASGAVASAADAPPKSVLRLHRLAPWAAVILAAVTVYLAVGA